jgi:hypothetical protein
MAGAARIGESQRLPWDEVRIREWVALSQCPLSDSQRFAPSRKLEGSPSMR